ncbi:MAG: hypothetical protein IPK52_21840 [Chloroflexi bacterium]|nr:hypothetical protein [Chloroflexota bacterium]
MSPDEGVQSFASDDGWHWQDAALIAVERTSPDGTSTDYAIGAVDLYANARTGDLGGSYLEIGTFDDVDQAAKFYHDLQTDIDNRMLLPFQLVDFAADAAKARGIESPAWRSAGPAEYAAYEALRDLDTAPMPDLPPADFVFGAPEVPKTIRPTVSPASCRSDAIRRPAARKRSSRLARKVTGNTPIRRRNTCWARLRKAASIAASIWRTVWRWRPDSATCGRTRRGLPWKPDTARDLADLAGHPLEIDR